MRICLRFLGGLLTAWLLAGSAPAELLDPGPYDALLRRYVNAGWVDYQGLAGERAVLGAYLGRISRVDPSQGTPEERLALWINAYNAGLLDTVLEHYPIKRAGLRGLMHPRGSVRQIFDLWDRPYLRIDEVVYSLNQIAHEVLRKRFAEPRVIFALAGAARSAPPLRSSAYRAASIERELDEAARTFLENPEHGLRVDPLQRTVWVSRLFAWCGEDFVPDAPALDLKGRELSQTEGAVLHFIRDYVRPEELELLDGADFSLSYMPYDWRLDGE